MPSAEANGKTFEFPEGTSPEQMGVAIDEYFQAEEQKRYRPTDLVLGQPEAVLSLASSAVAEPIAGLAGIAGSILPGEPGQGARFVESTRDALTFEPLSGPGKRQLNAIASIVAPVGEAIADIQQAVGDSAFEAAGSEGVGAATAGAVGQAAPEAALMAIPFLGGAIRRSKNAILQGRRQKIGEKLERGEGDTDTARFDLDEEGNVVKSPEATSAISQGFDEAVVASIKTASPADARQMLAMLERSRKASENARFGAANRPSDVVGDSLSKRINHVRRVNTRAGRRVDFEARNLEGKPIELDGPIDQFLSNLDDMGIKFDDKTGKLSFDGSDLQGLPGPQRTLRTVVKRLLDVDTPDARAAHRVKRFIDEQVTFGKTQRGLSGRAERLLKDLRRGIDGALDETYPAYKAANDQYSQTIQVLDDFQGVAGQKMDLYGPNADKAIGTLSRRLLSNAQSRINLMDVIDDLNDVAAKTGGKFDDDIVSQVMFVDELGRRFGASAKTSLQGDVEKAAERAARSSVREAVTDAVVDKTKAAFGRTDPKAYEAMRKLLERRLRSGSQSTPGTQLAPLE